MPAPTPESKAKRKAYAEAAWRKGTLRWKLDANQKKIYDKIKETNGASFYLNKARRIGGSFLLCVLAIETCIAKHGAKVKYAAPTAKAVRKIITPNIRKIIADCPPEWKPKFSLLEGEWKFPNESELTLAGCDNQNFENLRGTEADLVLVDECGFMDDLEYIIYDVLMPQVQDTKGKIVLCSTPPRSPAHESVKLAMQHKAAGNYHHSVVWDNPRHTRDQHIAFFQKIANGRPLPEYFETVTFKREYLAEFIPDAETAVIPEWDTQKEHDLVHEVERPPFFDAYVGFDLGWKDGMAAVFGYWDYRKAVLVIEDEYLCFPQKERKTADQIAPDILLKEASLWGKRKPHIRVADNDMLMINELHARGLAFSPTAKDDKEFQVNAVRELVKRDKIVFHPRCKRLISQLGSTTWNKARTSFERNTEGHGDLLDALIYLVRNIQRNKDPYPRNYGDDMDPFASFGYDSGGKSKSDEALLQWFTQFGEA